MVRGCVGLSLKNPEEESTVHKQYSAGSQPRAEEMLYIPSQCLRVVWKFS